MATRLGISVLMALVLAPTLAGCGRPDDTITEIENGENGTKIETSDGREHYLRPGIDQKCDTGDRLWVCATRRDLLIPQH